MSPPVLAPTDLPLPPAVAGFPAASQMTQLIHGFYCNIPSLSTENFQAVVEIDLSGDRSGYKTTE
jgi:hypothetical protein